MRHPWLFVWREAASEETYTCKPPLPPFTHETAVQKVRMAEDGWNGRNPEKVALIANQLCRSFIDEYYVISEAEALRAYEYLVKAEASRYIAID